jgi:hypothetical protein
LRACQLAATLETPGRKIPACLEPNCSEDRQQFWRYRCGMHQREPKSAGDSAKITAQ